MRKVILLIAAIMLAVMFTGCSKETSPEDRLSQYIKLWNAKKFDKMYGYLTDDAKQSITKEEFVNRYDKIYKDLEIDKLDVQFKKPEEEKKHKESANFPFSAKMDSAAGPIKFGHTAKLLKEKHGDEENWYIDWNQTYIFPELGKEDRLSYQSIPANRGSIMDRNGDMVAANGYALEIGVIPGQLGDKKKETIATLAKLLEMTEEHINKMLEAPWVKPDLLVPLKKISKDNLALQEKLFALDGVTSSKVNVREYPYGEAFSHLVGYVAPVTADDLKKLEGKGYTSSDLIGKRGLEQVLEERLRGENGVRISIKKKDGSEKLLAEKSVKDGEDVKLTIDVVLQQQIYDQMKGEAGAASAINPLTGETLALVSAPGFDPNAATLGFTKSQREEMANNPADPTLNRFKLKFAPGSVMKPITAAVGLSSDKISLDKAYTINEKRWQPNNSWGNYKVTRISDVKGQIDMEKALIYSDNIYFARVALDTGKDAFGEGLKKFGFEKELDYLYPLEPSTMGDIGKEITLADSGYGQGQIEMNILHLSAAYTPFVNKGNLIKPVLLADDKKSQVWSEGLITEEEAMALNGMLTKVVSDPRGSAHSAVIPNYPLAGKTGTAEIKAKQGEKGRELGWFVGYNPQSPNLLITMMIDNVQEKGGSKTAVSRVKNVFETRTKQ
ncbi:penicillin-binding transpeptidase domain-containing protein [Mesobacillus zeae]|uniref:serine-type D-Ala-D-Ala carboxypeptidase n=1 Tax=Mesobacillus zeae TaxID=1917180 RepID=A0A398B6Y4_9BACI|nr:penicillin-binding transpeptidase domain-containing protein [Mesobacillus zeae]RID83466.1 penicillin-binding transpeptidase domain-containing protein [Mesobacillus zeae]